MRRSQIRHGALLRRGSRAALDLSTRIRSLLPIATVVGTLLRSGRARRGPRRRTWTGVLVGRRTTDTRRALLALITAGLSVTGIAACSAGQANPGTTLAPVDSSASRSEALSTATDASSSLGSGTAAQPTDGGSRSETTPQTPESTSSEPTKMPWSNLDLSPDQVREAQAALDAYVGYRRVSDLTFTDPRRDWASEIYEYAADPVASNLVKFVRDPAFQQGSGEGRTIIDPRVTEVGTGTVELSDCVDNTASIFVDANGNSLIAPDAPGFYRRHPATVSVSQIDNRWLVTSVVNDFSVQC